MSHWARNSKEFRVSLPSGDRKARLGGATLTPSSPLQLVADDDCNSRSGWLGLALVAVVIGIVSLIAVVVLYCLSGSIPDEYGIVIDAGSSHSGVFLYKWNGRNKDTGVIKQVGSYCDVEDSLSSYANKPEDAGESLVPCLANISTLVPSQRRPLSALYLAATAGMRLLELAQPLASCRIMSNVKDVLKNQMFSFKNASIISGVDEGLYAWIATNYLDSRLTVTDGHSRPATGRSSRPLSLGSLDLGGASTQIVFEISNDTVTDHSRYLRLYGETYRLYVRSYLCCGANEMIRIRQATLAIQAPSDIVHMDPCLPLNYTLVVNSTEVFKKPCVAFEPTVAIPAEYHYQGTSDPYACRMLIDTSMRINSTCFVESEPRPEVSGNFVAFSGFYYIGRFFNCTSGCTKSQFNESVWSYCERPVGRIFELAPISFLYSYCFRGMYTLTLLFDKYKLTDSQFEQLKFLSQIGSADIGWTLGYMLNATNMLPAEKPTELIGVLEFSLVTAAACVMVLLGLSFLAFVIYRKFR
ncbi:ectonucleoside triphosphate diphosphohydrolase [Trichuris trichiura]|uniref:Ectonucleoside triphosphate diphosphohydrolase n=1 Tax=Trichuris trichiura TaxID=36087 RepID=A0A077Z4F5_TRITR|nr:ectonucleoside triphosphate diphosphohydrolase [Trichuris trichiura]